MKKQEALQEIRIPLSGDIMLPKDVLGLLDTMEMQRLRGLKQLGLSYLVYPGATHSRFEHSLGTAWALQNVLLMSNLNGEISSEDRNILTKAALLHDIGHPAFSHVTERLPNYPYASHKYMAEDVLTGKFRAEYEKHIPEDLEANFLCDLLSPKETNKILSIFSGHSDPPFLSQLICGFIDADVLDYLRRDSYYCGVNYGNYDDRIFRVYDIQNDQLVLDGTRDAVSAAESVFVGRRDMMEAVYRHHTTRVAESMLLAALEETLGDAILPRELFVLTDEELLSRIIERSESRYARKLAWRLKSRKLFKRAYVVLNQNRTRELEARLSRLSSSKVERHNIIQEIVESANSRIDQSHGEKMQSISFEDILFDFPIDSPYRELRDVYLAFSDGNRIRLEWISTRIRNLGLEYDNLWIFSALVSNEDIRQHIQSACEEIFGIESSLDFRKLAEKTRDNRFIHGMIERSEKEVQSRTRTLLKNIEETPRLSLEPIKVLAAAPEEWLTRTRLSKLVGLKPQTISYYLNKFVEKEDEIDVRLLESRTVKREKYWRILPEFKGHVASYFRETHVA